MIEETGVCYADGTHLEIPLIRRTYTSMLDYAADAKAGYPAYLDLNGHYGQVFRPEQDGVSGWGELEVLARDGWDRDLDEVLDLADIAIMHVEREIEQFEPSFSVTGASVDVASAVAGLPEDMIEYPLTQVSNVGSTVTVCCDVQARALVSAESITRRGMVIVALALALDQAQHQTELWVSDEYTNDYGRVILRTCVKGPNDVLDPAKIMFAYAHPAVQRGLGFCTVTGMPRPWFTIAVQDFGQVTTITKDFPEGTLYIEPMFRYSDSPNLDAEVRMYLTQLGLLADPDEDY